MNHWCREMVGPGRTSTGLMRKRQGGLKKSLVPLAPLLTPLTSGVWLLGYTWIQPCVRQRPPPGNKTACTGREVQLAWMPGCPMLAPLHLYSVLPSFPFLCTLQVLVRWAANPLPVHTVRPYPRPMPTACFHIGQQYSCQFAI